jgi:hypothetical protein
MWNIFKKKNIWGMFNAREERERKRRKEEKEERKEGEEEERRIGAWPSLHDNIFYFLLKK